VGRIVGIEIRVDSSWVVIALLITYSMYLRFSFLYKDLSTGAAVGIAILAAVLFFGSVLVHELAHALVSRARGIRVQDITLFLFGGATRARVESRGPRDEFLIAAVGPLTSGLVAGLFWIVDVFARGAAGAVGEHLRTLLGGDDDGHSRVSGFAGLRGRAPQRAAGRSAAQSAVRLRDQIRA